MTSTLAHSTSSSDRCEAQNRLTCRVHGVAGDFAEVPAVVEENIDRLRSLSEQAADAKVSLLEQAGAMKIRFSEIGYVTHDRNVAANYRAAEVDALTNLEDEYNEAIIEVDDEQDWQRGQVEGFLTSQVRHEFPHADAIQQDQLRHLAGLRFFGYESEWGEPESDAFKAAWDQERQSGLFGHLSNFETRAKLRQLDRAYFTALSGRIPTDEQLDDVEELRQLRAERPVNSADLDRTFALLGDLSAID